MDLGLMFDLALHMRDNTGEDYVFSKKRGITLNYKQQAIVLNKSIQAFMQGVGCHQDDKNLVIQAFTGSSALPQLTKDVFNVTQAVPQYDTLWQTAFQGIPLRKGELEWEIADVSSGFALELIPEGGKAKFYGISGAVESVKIYKYGAGLGITWETMEGRKLYKFVDQMMQARSRIYELWANTHYGILDTAAALNVIAYAGAATDPVIDRDIATINAAYEAIGALCRAKGYGDVANVPMLMFVAPNRKARVMQAMRATSSDIIRGRSAAATSTPSQVIEYNIKPFFSWNSQITTAAAIMVLPGNKVQNSMYMQELGLSERDIETLSEMKTYWTAFGCVIGDNDQVCQVTLT